MAQTLEALSRRMGTLQSIRGIVRTMKTLAAVNATPYDRAAGAIKAYHATILDGLQIFAHSNPNFELTASDSKASKIALIFGSDHGLCGGYNESILNAAIENGVSKNWRIFAVGTRMADELTSRGLVPNEVFIPPASVEGIGRLASEILIAIDRHRHQTEEEINVTMFFTRHGERGERASASQPLLPLDRNFLSDLRKRPWVSRALPILMMQPDIMFAALVRNHLFASLFGAAVEAMATENAARLALMQQAERSINDRYDEMLQETRSARQSEITNELLDVIVGYEALKPKSAKV